MAVRFFVTLLCLLLCADESRSQIDFNVTDVTELSYETTSLIPSTVFVTEGTTSLSPNTAAVTDEPGTPSPFCDTDPPCNFTEEILLNQAGCKPCVCKTDVMCQPCIRPLTDCCHCMCVDPTEPRPEIDDTEDPPPITVEQVKSAFSEMSDNMTEISEELNANRPLIKTCFGRPAFKKLKKLERYLNDVASAAGQIADSAMSANTLDDASLVAAIDSVANDLDGARNTMDSMYTSIQRAIETETSSEASNPNDPNSTMTALYAYYPTGQCAEAKTIVIRWHPYFWHWSYDSHWSFYHRIWYFWFCAWYIRIVIRLKVWFWWVWRPWGWPWFWPWGWCYNWWPWGWWWGWW